MASSQLTSQILTTHDLDILWTRIELEIDLPLTLSLRPISVHGISKLWVAPRKASVCDGYIRVHCRQCSVLAISVNDVPTTWEYLDPHSLIVPDIANEGDGEAFEVMQRASFMAANDGELCIKLPRIPSTHSRCEYDSIDQDKTHVIRDHALRQMRSRINSTSEPFAFKIEIKFNVLDPKTGYNHLNVNSGVMLYTSGSAVSSPDVDGVRCRWPCLDGSKAHHQAPIELVVTADTAYEGIASGDLISATNIITPLWMQHRSSSHQDEAFVNSMKRVWFVGPHCAISAVGLVLGTMVAVSSATDEENICHWAPKPLINLVENSSEGLEGAVLFCTDLIGVPFLSVKHTNVWIPSDCLGSLTNDVAIFANLCFMNSQLLFHPFQAAVQLSSHLTQLRSLLYAWLLPMIKIDNMYSDGWLLSGISGWLSLRWVEKLMGYDHARLLLQKLHDYVISKERKPGVAPISRGAAFSESSEGRYLGVGATDDPLVSGNQSSDERAFQEAKSVLMFHMMEQRLGEQGRHHLLTAIHMLTFNQTTITNISSSSSSEKEKEKDEYKMMEDKNIDTKSEALIQNDESSHEETAFHITPIMNTPNFFNLVNGSETIVGDRRSEESESWMEQWILSSGVALLKCKWSYHRSKNSIEVIIEQVVPEWRGNNGDAGHTGPFQGQILIRVVEVDDVVVDHVRLLGSDLKYPFMLKCSTNKSQMKKRSQNNGGTENVTSSSGASQSGVESEGGVLECPVLWVKVDPDYAWAREIVMEQPLDSWTEQLARDGDADAQIDALRSLAELPHVQDEEVGRAKVAPHKPPAILADVVRGVALPCPSQHHSSAVGSLEQPHRETPEEHGWAIRVAAAEGLARWQVMHAPRTGVATLDGAWRGRDMLRVCLSELFCDHESKTPLPLHSSVVRACAPTTEHVNPPPSSFASSALHISILEALAVIRAENGATPIDVAKLFLNALEYIDDQGPCYGEVITLKTQQQHDLNKQKQHSHFNQTMSNDYAVSRLLCAIGDVFLKIDEVASQAEEWRRATMKHAARLFQNDRFRCSHNHVISAAALQLIASLTILQSGPVLGNIDSPIGSQDEMGEWYMARWIGPENPDCIRLVAMVGLVQQHAASGDAIVNLAGLRMVLESLFLENSTSEPQLPSNKNNTTFSSSSNSEYSSSQWLRHRVISAITNWLTGSMGVGGVLANQDILHTNPMMSCFISKQSTLDQSFTYWYSSEKASLSSSPRQIQLAKICRDLVRGSCGYGIKQTMINDNVHHGYDKIEKHAIQFCHQFYNIMNSTCKYDQQVRYHLHCLWVSLLGSEIPPCLKQNKKKNIETKEEEENSFIDSKSLIYNHLAMQPIVERQIIRHLEVPDWAIGDLEGLRAHVRIHQFRRRKAPQCWIEPKRAKVEERRKIRLLTRPGMDSGDSGL